ncbi:helix-turn-helix domain-containing protein [Streptomyces europaeiscabiei]|uniref:helix-turn-helix domain-containing protein n=1 Tax=Streptomyces europaeiscabiei TaxID=146819 RepID=UPI0038D4D55D
MVAFAELERDMIVEPTRAGLDAAKAQGRTGGRPTVITEDEPTVAKAAEGESVSAIAEALGVSRATLYRPIGRPRTLPPPL